MNNMNSMNKMFGSLGIFGNAAMPMASAKTDKKETKPEKKENNAKKDAKKKETTSKKKNEQKYKGPLTLVFDSIASVEIAEEKEFTKEELLSEASRLSGFSVFETGKDKFNLNKLSDGRYYVVPGYIAKYEKGNEGKHLLLEQMHELEGMIEPDEAGDITAEMVKAYIEEHYGMNVVLYLVEDVYIPQANVSKRNGIEDLSFPVKVTSLTLFGEIMEIGKEEYLELAGTAVTKEEEDNEEQMSLLLEGEEVEKPLNITEEGVKTFLKAFFPEYADDLEYNYIPEKNLLQVMHKSIFSASSSAPKAKKEETYPTNATISLFFTKYELSPDMFGGKKEITSKEVIKFLQQKKHLEYSVERTTIEYDKKNNLILPLMKSGKRGYSLEDNDEYRREETPIMTVCATKQECGLDGCVPGTVYFNLPKIPFSILKEIVDFFWDVYVLQRTEAVALIFYNLKEEKYEICIPDQYVSIGEVDFDRDIERETDEGQLLVMEIHSHGAYRAFWSGTDNADEVMHRLYAVVGGFTDFAYDYKHIRVRAATGGYHVRMDITDVFEFPSKNEEFNEKLKKVYLSANRIPD